MPAAFHRFKDPNKTRSDWAMETQNCNHNWFVFWVMLIYWQKQCGPSTAELFAFMVLNLLSRNWTVPVKLEKQSWWRSRRLGLCCSRPYMSITLICRVWRTYPAFRGDSWCEHRAYSTLRKESVKTYSFIRFSDMLGLFKFLFIYWKQKLRV